MITLFIMLCTLCIGVAITVITGLVGVAVLTGGGIGALVSQKLLKPKCDVQKIAEKHMDDPFTLRIRDEDEYQIMEGTESGWRIVCTEPDYKSSRMRICLLRSENKQKRYIVQKVQG